MHGVPDKFSRATAVSQLIYAEEIRALRQKPGQLTTYICLLTRYLNKGNEGLSWSQDLQVQWSKLIVVMGKAYQWIPPR